MKSIATKIVLFVCVICIVLTGGVTIYAADTQPKVSITLDNAKKNAQIKLQDVGIMIYSAQITLSVDDAAANYTVTAQNNGAYSTVKTNAENKEIVLYIDSTELMDGSKEVNLATLKSDTAMNIGRRAKLILIDRSMRSVSYDNVVVSIGNESNNQGPGRNPGGTTSSDRNQNGTSSGITIPTTPAKPKFTDIENGYWAADSIAYVTEKGLFTGVTDTTFAPSAEMTRAMYVVVLNRFGTKVDTKWQIPCTTPKKFSDIPDGEWYSEAVAWAGGTGLVNGMGENMFDPYRAITREQIAVMTVNFARLCGVTLPNNVAAIEFTDAAGIHDWASDAVRIAQQAGLINGRTDGSFSPQDTATRGEVAAILHRFVELVK